MYLAFAYSFRVEASQDLVRRQAHYSTYSGGMQPTDAEGILVVDGLWQAGAAWDAPHMRRVEPLHDALMSYACAVHPVDNQDL
jgi:hypothetical protein